MRRFVLVPAMLAALLCYCRTGHAPLEHDSVRFDFGMVETGIEWLDFINTGADDRAVMDFFMREVAPTNGCRSIIHHWERFMTWDNEEFYTFIMEALGRIPSEEPIHGEDGSLTMFGRRRRLWQEALHGTESLRRSLDILKTTDFSQSIDRAKEYLPPGIPLKAEFYVVLFGHSNAYSVGEENGFDLLQLPKTRKGTIDIDAVVRLFAHELHHTGFSYCTDKHIPEPKKPENILLLGLLAAEGMPTYFLDEPYFESRLANSGEDSSDQREIEDWRRHSARIDELYREAEHDITENLKGSLSQGDILGTWMQGAKGPAYVLGAHMFSVVDEYLGTDEAVSIAQDYRIFLEVYNAAARIGLERGADLFLFREDLARELTVYQ